MSEEGPAEDTRRVYVTPKNNLCRHSGEGQRAASLRFRYICVLSSRTEATYCLVSAYIPLFCTEYRPW